MRPIDEPDNVSQDEPSLVGAERLLAYEQAKAAGDGPSLERSSGATQSDPLANDLACVDLLHRVWPDFDDRPPPEKHPLAEQHPPAKILGDFRLLREIGRGGMGVVYEAEQISMGRTVALKVLPFAALVQDKSLQRFRNEVRAAAALNHPHIVAVYFVGEERGVHFYAMQFIRGQSLAEAICELRKAERKKSQPAIDSTDDTRAIDPPAIDPTLTPPSSTKRTIQARKSTAAASPRSAETYCSAARLGIQAAEAMQHAHDLGVLHRDIKPSNLLLDREGDLYVADFGLARIEADASLTMTGDIIGTLRYMAPEQALAKRVVVDHRADIYSLGATLYELLTLEPAFSETDRSELLKQIAFEEPRPLRKLDRRIPTELETIVLKAMSKRPEDRYQTAQHLADDLRRFMENKPIQARPPTYADRLVKWSWRHQSLVTTAAVALMLISGVLLASMALVNRARLRAVASFEKTSDLLYVADMTVAYKMWEVNLRDEAQAILNRHQPQEGDLDRRGFEWHLLNSIVQQPETIELTGHVGSVNEIAVFPDRYRLASVGDDGTLRIWEMRSGELLKTIKLTEGPLYSVAISRDSRFVAAGSNKVYLCDLDNQDRIEKIFPPDPDSKTNPITVPITDTNIESLAFRADGERIAVGFRYDKVFLITPKGEVIGKVESGTRLVSLEFLRGGSILGEKGAVSPANSLLLLPYRKSLDGDFTDVAQLWNHDLSEVKEEFSCPQVGEPGEITVARSSFNERFILAGKRRRSNAAIFDRSSGRVVVTTPASRGQLIDLAYSPNGKTIALAYQNGVVEGYAVRTRRDGTTFVSNRPNVIRMHQDGVNGLKFVESDVLATCGADGLVKIWRFKCEPEQIHRTRLSVRGIRLSPDGSRLLFTQPDGCRLVETDNKKRVSGHGLITAPGGNSAWFSSGDRFAICEKDSIRVLKQSGEQICSFAHAGSPSAVAVSPDGRLVASIGDQTLQIFDMENRREIMNRCLPKPGRTLAFSHDARWLAYAGDLDRINILAVAELGPERELRCSGDVGCLAYSPDDSILATGHDDGFIRFWETTTGRLRAEFVGHEREIQDVEFTPDGQTLLSSGSDGTVRLASVEHGCSYGIFYRAPVANTNPQVDQTCRVSLSADGRRLAIGYGDSVFVWCNSPTGWPHNPRGIDGSPFRDE